MLLYDIAMKLSRRQQICMIHCGNAGKEWKILHKRLQRIAFLSDNQLTENTELKTLQCRSGRRSTFAFFRKTADSVNAIGGGVSRNIFQ